jgi:hypothetical protein
VQIYKLIMLFLKESLIPGGWRETNLLLGSNFLPHLPYRIRVRINTGNNWKRHQAYCMHATSESNCDYCHIKPLASEDTHTQLSLAEEKEQGLQEAAEDA